MRKALLALTGIFALVGAGPASANAIFQTGNHHQPNEFNIFFGAAESGPAITGATKFPAPSGVSFTFSTTTGQTLVQQSQGQADISASSGGLTSLNITAAAGFGFTDFIMNPMKGSGTATVTALDQGTNLGGSNPFDLSLGGGQNFLTITTENGEFITEITITLSDTDSFKDFKQPRVSGLCTLGTNNTCTPIPTPEPTTLSLLGLGLVGLGIAGRRKRRRRAA
jgi:hypothetical protein